MKASLGKYVHGDSPIGNPAGRRAPRRRGPGTTRCIPSSDPRGNFNPDCDLAQPSADGECGAGSANFGSLRSVARSMRTHASAGATGLQLGVLDERAARAAPRLGIDVGYFRRWFGNFRVIDNLGLTPADFDRYSITAPLDPRLPDGGGY